MGNEKSQQYIWCIAWISSAHIDKADIDLQKFDKYNDITAYIPTVKILKKLFKGEEKFDYVPLLFNYGFFKIPKQYAVNVEFLAEMRQNINCIFAWVSDPIKVINTRPTLRADNKFMYTEKNVPVATASDKEVAELIKVRDESSVHSLDEMDNIQEGMIVTLRGYPFDNMPAKIIEVQHDKKKVRVELLMEFMVKEQLVSFDNVFYTIYGGAYDDSLGGEKSLDEIEAREGNSLDKLIINLNNETD